MTLALVAALILGATAAAAQGLPVKTYGDITSFRGNRAAVIAVTDAPPARYTLLSAHKEARRPWADAVIRRESPEGVSFLSRAYDCANATYRWLGEAASPARLSLSVTDLRQLGDRPLLPGTIEHRLAAYVCAL